jgi:hypothetical protein
LLGRTLLKSIGIWPEAAFAGLFGGYRMAGWLLAACSVYLRAIAIIEVHRRWKMIVAAKLLGMAAMLAFAWVTRPAGEPAVKLGLEIRGWFVIAAMACATAFSLWIGLRIGGVLVIGSYLLIRLIRGWTLWRCGGATYNALLASVLIVETFAYAMLAAMRRVW